MRRQAEKIRQVLRVLASGSARAEQAAAPASLLLESGRGPALAVPAKVLRQMAMDGLVARRGAEICISAAGRSWLVRDGKGQSAFACQHGEWIQRDVAAGSAQHVNLAESPLSMLARMREKSGRNWLSEDEVRAGERLRADFSYGQLSPRMGVNWQAACASSGSGGAADLADSVVAARMRVNRALKAVGPELADVLIDVCCFLKGMTQVETERGWPARSAKLILRTALAALSRHYQPVRHEKPRESVRHWGVENYRPSQFSGDAGS